MDATLVERARSGDDAAFAALVAGGDDVAFRAAAEAALEQLATAPVP